MAGGPDPPAPCRRAGSNSHGKNTTYLLISQNGESTFRSLIHIYGGPSIFSLGCEVGLPTISIIWNFSNVPSREASFPTKRHQPIHGSRELLQWLTGKSRNFLHLIPTELISFDDSKGKWASYSVSQIKTTPCWPPYHFRGWSNREEEEEETEN